MNVPQTAAFVVRSEGGLPRYKLRRLAAYVSSNIGDPISLDDLADVARLSRFHFHRQFRKSLGITPHQYVLRMRIDRAKVLLARSNLTVGKVAAAVGFVAQSHFCNIFRKMAATTPRRYRNYRRGSAIRDDHDAS